MRAFVGITDGDWFELLRRLSPPEVNFWQPGGKVLFQALDPGELFLFKLHSPDNFIVGGGIFAHSTRLPVSLAWDAFGTSNGAVAPEEMRSRIKFYRRRPGDAFEDYTIGCIVLTQPFFLPRTSWVPVPPDWKPNIVQGRSYDLEKEPGLSLFHSLESALAGGLAGPGRPEVRESLQERYGKPVVVSPRLGQGAFRVVVTDAYERRCAISGERVLPVLEAAHIHRYARGGEHRVENGILLRRDLHTLFDRGYFTIDPSLRIEVSRRIREEFENGRDYYAFHGKSVRLPVPSKQGPARQNLLWHNENVFRG